MTSPLMKRILNDYMESKFQKDVFESLCNNEKVATVAFSSNALYDLKCDIYKIQKPLTILYYRIAIGSPWYPSPYARILNHKYVHF